jgi:DNA topoisomerase-1
MSDSQVLQLRARSRLAARAAGLKYIEDGAKGLRRVRRGKSFGYVDERGAPVRDAAQLERIRKLAIPPAYTDVWVCSDPNGHLQAHGRDARGRKQYRYHARWSAARDNDKHRRISEFATELPKLRAHCDRLLRRPGLSRDKLMAALLRIVDLTAIRVGHEEYTRDNDSFGLTTLRKRHAKVRGNEVELKFRGKSGIMREVRFRDARLAKIISACRALRGPQLFQYVDEAGKPRPIHADHLNAYLRTITAERFSVKDFRTWSATVSVAVELRTLGPATSQRAAKKSVLAAVRKAAEYLGNTPSVCRKSYVHPTILEAYLAGQCLPEAPASSAAGRAGQGLHEECVLAFLDALAKKVKAGASRAVVTPLERAS